MKQIALKNSFIVILFSFLMSFYASAQSVERTFTSSSTFTVPQGVTQLTVEAWGGGGKGGTRTSNGIAGGGGGGAYARKIITVVPGNTYTVTVGNGATTTAAGGDSWFWNQTTLLAKGGNSVTDNNSNGALGGDKTACVGDVTFSGGNGSNGSSGSFSGGGGSSAGTDADGNNATTSAGATAPSGGGVGGNGRTTQGAGNPGQAPGGGGGGGMRTSNSTRSGGNGGNGRIIIRYDAPEINVTGNGNTIPDNNTTTSTTNFTDLGTTDVGVALARTFVIQNTGTLNLTIGAFSITGTHAANFTLTSAPATSVAPGGTTTFTVTFNPTATGIRTAAISFVNSDEDENPYNFALSGTGTTPEIDLRGNGITIVDGDTTPSLTDFTVFEEIESVPGSTSSRTFTIFNTGNSTLNLTGTTLVQLSNTTQFTVTQLPNSSIPAGGSTTFTITFSSLTAGTFNCDITIANNDLNENPYNFRISGTAILGLPNGPGGVRADLKLWLRSDLLNGTTTVNDNSNVTVWNTQGRGSDAVKPTATRAPKYRNHPQFNINFNAVVDFTNDYNSQSQVYTDNATNREYLKGTSGFHSQELFVVMIPDVPVSHTNNTMDIFCGDRDPSVNETDVTGVGIGDYSSRFNNEVLAYCVGVNSRYGIAQVSTTTTYSNVGIINARQNSGNTGADLFYNDGSVGNTTVNGATYENVSNSRYWIGRSKGWDGSLDGRVAEIITLSRRTTDIERSNIQSYLAVKYGITLGTNGISKNYTNSDGNLIWDATQNAGFNFDIAGIGRDDISRLNQKQSKSVNPNTVLTIGLGDIATTNTANTNTFATDKSYLIWGSNGQNMNNSGNQIAVDLGPVTITTFTDIVNRKWKVVENGGDVGTVKVAIPTAAFTSGLPALGPTDAYVMIVATNATFTTGVEMVFMSTSGTNQVCSYDFDGTKFISFGVAHRQVQPLHVTLDGDDDFIKIDDVNQIGTNFTLMAWVRPNGNNTANEERTVLAKRTETTGYRLVIQNDNKIRMEWTNAGNILQLVSNTALPEGIWHNIAVTYSGGTGLTRIYIDGVIDQSANLIGIPETVSAMFTIGAEYINKNNIKNRFKGDIDEVRVWNRALNQTQIRFIMNQEIEVSSTNNTRGKVLLENVTKNDVSALPWSSLIAYYSMNSYIGTHLDDDSNFTNRGSLVIPDKISIGNQTAPLPYTTQSNGSWDEAATWNNGIQMEAPYSLSIVNGTPIAWNIIKTNHNVVSNGNKVVLAAFIEANELKVENNTKFEVTHYLKLDGKIDLEGRSQLIQTLNSDLDPISSGSLHRDQQGQSNRFNYNYWSSPVSSINNTTINHGYTVAGVMKDGTNTALPQNITWTSSHNGSPTSPITLSRNWIYKFQNVNGAYANWTSVGQNGQLLAGQGYTLKGSGAATPNQNYIFVGKPNNGLITTEVAATNMNLSGNPYPSALDANLFITENLGVIEGTLYFWEHFTTNTTHNLSGYQGGYAARTLVGGTAPVAPAGVSGLGSSSKIARRYIPVGQGFFIKGNETGGTVVFNNNMRTFIREENSNSNTVFRTANATTSANHFYDNSEDEVDYDRFMKIRLGFNSYNNFHRQLLIGFMENLATENFDPGYDAIHIDNQQNDMYFVLGDKKLVIQGESYFDSNKRYPLGVKTHEAGNIQFTLDGTENVDENQKIYVYDKQTEIYHNLRNGHATIMMNAAGIVEDRFELVFINQTLGLSNPSVQDAIQVVFANQTNTLTIQNKNSDCNVENVQLYTILGQLLHTWTPENGYEESIAIPVQNMSTGTYIVRVTTNLGTSSKKIIIK